MVGRVGGGQLYPMAQLLTLSPGESYSGGTQEHVEGKRTWPCSENALDGDPHRARQSGSLGSNLPYGRHRVHKRLLPVVVSYVRLVHHVADTT